MIRWIISLFRSKDRVSNEWLYQQTLSETKEGWEGPSWRFPAEIVERDRLERKRKISLARRSEEEDRKRA